MTILLVNRVMKITGGVGLVQRSRKTQLVEMSKCVPVHNCGPPFPT